MARRITSACEIGIFALPASTEGGWDALWVGSSTPMSIDTGVKRSGAGSVKINVASAAASNIIFDLGPDPSLGVGVFARAYLRIDNLPNTNCRIMQGRAAAGTSLFAVVLTTAGNVRLINGASGAGGTQFGSDAAETITAGDGKWHLFQFKCKLASGALDEGELYLNGVLVASTTAQTLSDSTVDRIEIGWIDTVTATRVMYVDDVAINDESGSTETGYPAPCDGTVVLLPTADSARVGWTGGAGGTTNLFAAVDNKPPAGVANASATNTSQIKDANANTTDAYTATMQTYIAAGVPSGATIRIVQAMIRVGSGGAAAGQYKISVASNPNQGATDTTVATSATAATTDAQATSPSTWFGRVGTAIVNPSVDLGTAPTLTLTKGTSAVTQHCSFMGLVVEYTMPPSRAMMGVGG